MPNYQNGKIYCIRSHQTDEIYIGSTTQPLAMRLGGHKANYRLFQTGKYHDVTSFKIVKYPDSYIELIESYPCASKNELDRREGEIIRSRDCVNKAIPGRTMTEYREDNKEHIKQYREDNKEHISQYFKQYHEANRERISQRNKQPIFCPMCQCSVRKDEFSRHSRSSKHVSNRALHAFIHS